MAIGNRHRKIGKDCTCGSGDILVDRQTDTQANTHTQTCSPQYIAATPVGEVTSHEKIDVSM